MIAITLKTVKASVMMLCLFLCTTGLFAQEDSSAVEEEDWSIYDDLEFADEGTKRFASAKIKGLSPAQFISVGYDYQAPYDITAGAFGSYAEETATATATHGLRVGANVPVYSRNNLIVQLGGQLWDVQYDMDREAGGNHPLLNSLGQNGLRTLGLNTTIFKPLNEYSFLLVQANVDMNGDYSLTEFQDMRYNRYSAAAIWGRRPNDNCQWGVGLSRTYRAGELNYIPVLLYNKTSVTGKWGTEILFPARGHVRYRVNARSLVLGGFELEGNSYRIGNQGMALAPPLDELELRKSELRFRLNYQRQITGFFWVSVQAGYRVMYSFNVDAVPEGQDFFRGFFGDQAFAIENRTGNPLYANISINFVSP